VYWGGIILGTEDLGSLERPIPLVVGNTDIVVGVRGDTRRPGRVRPIRRYQARIHGERRGNRGRNATYLAGVCFDIQSMDEKVA